jgi:hypothetical protein
MKILLSDLESAAQKGIITSSQVKTLWEYFDSLRPDQAKFQALHVLYYFGGILILASMSWFLTTAWNDGRAVMAISGLFALMYVFVGNTLWTKQHLKIPGGLLITAAVGLTPVFIYGFQNYTGLWPQQEPSAYRDYHIWVKGSWLFMEIGTIIAAIIALRFFRFAFITFPLAITLWYMSMDLTPLLFGKDDFSFDERKLVSCIFGLVVLIGSYFVDKKYRDTDFAFWTYLYGMLAFWGGLSMMDSNSELNKLIYCILNVGFIFVAVYLRRRVFIVFGTIGVLGYIGHLARKVFEDSYAFPIVLALLGIFIVFLGVKYQKNKDKFEALVESCLPTFLMKWRPTERV